MRKWLKKMSGLKASSRGQTTAEYAIIVALVAVSSIAVILIFGDQIRELFAAEKAQLAGDNSASVQDAGDAESVKGGSMKDF